MKRVLEPELMEDEAQVKAYAEADFEIPHSQFIERLQVFVNEPRFSGTALDLGCGPGDISRRFAKAYPLSKVYAVDGSAAMINYGKLLIPDELKSRIKFIHGLLPHVSLPQADYGIIFSNSLLHHLPDPMVLWDVIKKYAVPGTRIVVMDLLRPDSIDEALTMVQAYAADEPDILKRDFYQSLLAAFRMDEIAGQIAQAGLDLSIEQISDRHVFITGVAA
ncbi:class I SAM-dependent methyltransferase [Methylobacter sp. YRD-M1]|uniref:class I SAM-dependent methyltransferase n=1 Tax=Methylobacter sp. YRD-M1 TaxID=2911520 RepID=UPI00227CE5BE|nr:class I SAM-dependent methyltransferase [Methylobacter sp. YRD-M1]WAK04096.1 class I SAM-dependent methyltransferase [Methylobacter sp. YRD-M1]